MATSTDAVRAAEVSLQDIKEKKDKAFVMFVFKDDGTFSIISNIPADSFFNVRDLVGKCLDHVGKTKFSN